MTTTSRASTLAELVADAPAIARILDGHGLDYCCHGDRSLADACAEAGIDAPMVERDIAAVTAHGDIRWRDLDIADLADHIEQTHHAYLHVELPALEALAVKVRDVHGERHPELFLVAELAAAIRADLEPHLLKEERVLFPAIREVKGGRRNFPFGSIANPIGVLTSEHDRAGALLAEMRSVTGSFVVPSDGCASYRSLYERLVELELDIHLHVLKENHVLFPEAVAAAEALGTP